MRRVSLVIALSSLVGVVAAQPKAPQFEVDKLWPKPLPNHWILGSITGIAIDAQDHIWLVHRGLDSLTARTEAGTGTTPPTAEDCCAPAPSVLEFDAAGNLLGHWGGPGQGFDWPVSPGGIEVDAKGNVWITAAGAPEPLTAARGAARTGGAAAEAAAGGAGAAGGRAAAATPPAGAGGAAGAAGVGAGGQRGGGRGGNNAPPRPEDAQVLKFSRTGQFLLQIGKAGQVGDANSHTNLDHPVDMAVDTAANEVYVADGGASQRVVVFDSETGAFKRQWSGGHGTTFGKLSAIAMAKDGTLYVADRKTNRIQSFKKDGSFVSEGTVSPSTTGFGSVWGLGLSSEAAQRYLFVADGQDEQIFILDRSSLATLGNFGDGGRWPGTFRAVGSVAMDSKGNLYTGENYEGKRLQKFLKK